MIFQRAELCVLAGVCLGEQADRLLAGSVMIHGCFHVAYSCCVGEEQEVTFNM